MKIHLLLPLAASLLTGSLLAQDTTPPVLDIQHTWIEKVGTIIHFKMLLDPRDETGLPGFPATAIQFRSKLNSTAALPANTPWNDYPWVRGQPFSVGFNCTSVVFEIRAKDAAGNFSLSSAALSLHPSRSAPRPTWSLNSAASSPSPAPALTAGASSPQSLMMRVMATTSCRSTAPRVL